METSDKRQCGQCGKAVGAADVLCPHCDVLLAAYEAPSGSGIGTAAALTPVEMPSIPLPTPIPPPSYASPLPSDTPAPREYVSPVAQALEARRDADTPRDPSTATFTSPGFDLPESSPIAQAVQETRVAAEEAEHAADAQSTAAARRSAPTESKQATNSPERTPTKPHERLHPKPEARTMKAQPMPIATPSPETSPVDRTLDRSNQSQPGNSSSIETRTSSIGNTVVYWIIGVVILQFLGRTIGWAPLIVLVIIVVALIQWMRTLAKSSGRKTTNMPRDP